MVAEGYNYWETPIENWLNYNLRKIILQGGKPQLLTEYEKERKQNADELVEKMEKLNNSESWH